MLTRIQKWGNSQGVRVPAKVLREANLEVDAEVDVAAENGRIVIEPSQRIRGRYKLAELVARIPEDYKPGEEEWGEPMGREVW